MVANKEHDAAVVVNAPALQLFASDALAEAGLPEDHAETVAQTLVDANLRGIDTHGVVRLAPYLERIEQGGINPQPELETKKKATSAAIVDGDDGPGQVNTLRATKEAIAIADTTGAGIVGVQNSNHFGTASFFTNYAAKEGYIGISMTHAGPNVVPFGGADPYFGTNPLSFSAPTGRDFPITLDMATSITAKGNVILAEEEGEEIPSEWALDESGKPTTDPADFHALRPMAGPKGYGLALMIDIFCGVLMDTVFGDDVPTMYHDVSEPQKLGHFVIVLDIEAFLELETFVNRIDTVIEELKQVRSAEGFNEVLLPGEPEERTRQHRLDNGIPLGDGVWETLGELGDRYDISLDSMAQR